MRNMNILRNFVIFVIRSKLQAIFARWPTKHCKLSDTFLFVFFYTECRLDLENMMDLLSIYRTSYVLSKCVLNVKPWMI